MHFSRARNNEKVNTNGTEGKREIITTLYSLFASRVCNNFVENEYLCTHYSEIDQRFKDELFRLK